MASGKTRVSTRTWRARVMGKRRADLRDQFLMGNDARALAARRLQRWSFFSCDAMVMFYFLQRCDSDYFWTFPTIAIIAIIFPNYRDRLYCDVCIILRLLGGFEGFWRFWFLFRSFGGFEWGFEGFWGFFEGFWRFLGVFKVNITIVAIIFLNHRDRLFCDVFWDDQ